MRWRGLLTLALWIFATVGFIGGTISTCVLLGKVPPPLKRLFKKQGSTEAPIPWAIVNREKIKAEAVVFKKFTDFIESCNKNLQQEFQSKEKLLRVEYEAINRQEAREKKPSKALTEKKQAFNKKLAEVEQMVQQKKEILDKAVKQCTEAIDEKFKTIIEAIAERYQTNVIIEASMAVYSEGVDLTDSVIEELDTQMKSFVFPILETS